MTTVEIRWHGRGGQGVVTANEILAAAATVRPTEFCDDNVLDAGDKNVATSHPLALNPSRALSVRASIEPTALRA